MYQLTLSAQANVTESQSVRISVKIFSLSTLAWGPESKICYRTPNPLSAALVTATPRPLYPWECVPLPVVQKAGCTPGLVWKGAENLASLTAFNVILHF